MTECVGRIVQAAAGRDKGGFFCVVGLEREGPRLLLADGKRRKCAQPKVKKPSHVRFFADEFDHPAIQKLKQGKALSDRELRRALAAFRDQLEV